MKRRVLVVGLVVGVLALAGGIAWALWSANSIIHTSLQLSARPSANITGAVTNDDGVVAQPLWDGGDTGPDPSGPGPGATRYGTNVGNCVASLGPAANEASLSITAAYGGYWCDGMFGIQNSGGSASWMLTAVKVNTVTALADCPTMTPTDLNADTLADIEACVAKLVEPANGTYAPVINTVWGVGEGRMVKVSLHVMDSATGGVTRLFDIVFVGSTQ